MQLLILYSKLVPEVSGVKSSTVLVPPAQDLGSSVWCMRGMSRCCPGKHRPGDTMEKSLGFCLQISEKCSGFVLR